MRNNKSIQKKLRFFSKNKWVIGGNIYIRNQQKGFFRESPIVIGITLKKDIPKYEYVSLGFVLDDVVATPEISIIKESKIEKNLPPLHLIGKF